jgi:hypothetical protein
MRVHTSNYRIVGFTQSVEIDALAELAHRHELLLTGGTDFHGAIQPEIAIGSGRGDLFVPYELYEKLINPPWKTAHSGL